MSRESQEATLDFCGNVPFHPSAMYLLGPLPGRLLDTHVFGCWPMSSGSHPASMGRVWGVCIIFNDETKVSNLFVVGAANT